MADLIPELEEGQPDRRKGVVCWFLRHQPEVRWIPGTADTPWRCRRCHRVRCWSSFVGKRIPWHWPL